MEKFFPNSTACQVAFETGYNPCDTCKKCGYRNICSYVNPDDFYEHQTEILCLIDDLGLNPTAVHYEDSVPYFDNCFIETNLPEFMQFVSRFDDFSPSSLEVISDDDLPLPETKIKTHPQNIYQLKLQYEYEQL